MVNFKIKIKRIETLIVHKLFDEDDCDNYEHKGYQNHHEMLHELLDDSLQNEA